MAREVPHPFPTTAEGQLALVLWLVWDPIPSVPDEYRSYAPALLRLLRSGVTDTELAAALGRLRTKLGGPLAIDHDRRAAWTLLEWYEWFLDDDEPPLDSDGRARPLPETEPWLPG